MAKGKLIEFVVGAAISCPIATGTYKARNTSVAVSYPKALPSDYMPPRILPQSYSVEFVVSWHDKNGKTEKRLKSKTCERHFDIHRAIDIINELIIAFQLASIIGRSSDTGLRTIGLDDRLYSFARIDGQQVGDLNVGLQMKKRDYPLPGTLPNSKHPDDPNGITELAIPHIATETYPVARRYIRCFKLLKHGYYTESLIIAFAIFDDIVQKMIDDLLRKKKIDNEKDRDILVKGISKRRMKIYLGPLLKILTEKSFNELWKDADRAIDWLNKQRNEAVHTGPELNYGTSAVAIYVCIKALVELHKHNLISAEFPVEMYRYAKITAAWTENPPEWVPRGKDAESWEFD